MKEEGHLGQLGVDQQPRVDIQIDTGLTRRSITDIRVDGERYKSILYRRRGTSGSLESTSSRVLAPEVLPCTNSVSAATHASACSTLLPSISGSSSANRK